MKINDWQESIREKAAATYFNVRYYVKEIRVEKRSKINTMLS
jgi:hypothetical protein